MSHKQFLPVCNSVDIIKAYFLELDLGAGRLLRARGYYVLGFVGGGGGHFQKRKRYLGGYFMRSGIEKYFPVI